MSGMLILSDGRAGHLNQSIALAKYLSLEYEIVNVNFYNRFYKGLSYVFDRLKIHTDSLFEVSIEGSYDMVVGAGSSTYYAIKTLAKKMKITSVVMMLPKGYRYDFDVIFAQSHDNPPKQKNIIEIPANFSYVEPKGIYVARKKSIGLIIGGDNKVFTLSLEILTEQLDFIKSNYNDYEIAVTTSPRTSGDVEKLVASYGFSYEVLFSQNPINPIPDFLEQCETVYITGDSTSMVSEAIGYGHSNIVVLPLESDSENKFRLFAESLFEEGYVDIFDGKIEHKNKKIDFASYAQQVML